MDIGLLGALGQGLSQGIDSYRSERDYKSKLEQAALDKALQKKQREQDMMMHGWMLDEAGNPAKGADLIAKESLDQQKTLAEIEKIKADAKNKDNGLDAFSKQLNIKKSLADLEKGQFEKTPVGRLQKSGSEEKSKIGYIVTALQGLEGAKNTYLDPKGAKPSRINPSTPFIGNGLLNLVPSDPYYEQAILFSENLGRLNSGGVINDQETKRFMQMLPAPADDKKTALRKFDDVRKMALSRLKAFGYDESDLSALGLGQTTPEAPTPGGPSLGLVDKKPGMLDPKSLATPAKPMKMPDGKTWVENPDGTMSEVK